MKDKANKIYSSTVTRDIKTTMVSNLRFKEHADFQLFDKDNSPSKVVNLKQCINSVTNSVYFKRLTNNGPDFDVSLSERYEILFKKELEEELITRSKMKRVAEKTGYCDSFDYKWYVKTSDIYINDLKIALSHNCTNYMYMNGVAGEDRVDRRQRIVSELNVIERKKKLMERLYNNNG